MDKVENGGRLGPLGQNLPSPTGPLDPPVEDSIHIQCNCVT